MADDFYMRTATVEDIDLIVLLFSETAIHYGLDVPEPEVFRQHIANDVLRPEATSELVIIFSDAEVAAYATYSVMYPAPNASGQMYMKELFVREAFRSGGIGAWTMREMAKLAVSNGCSRLDWTTEITNPRAVAFYENMGAEMLTEKRYFRVDGERLTQLADREDF